MIPHRLASVLGFLPRLGGPDYEATSSNPSLGWELGAALDEREAPANLGTVLSENGNVTTYYSLIKNNSDFLLQLPNEKGVTVSRRPIAGLGLLPADLSSGYQTTPIEPDGQADAPSQIVAPNDDAFKKYEGWDPNNQSLVLEVLKYHTIQGAVSMAGIPSGPSTFEPTLLEDVAYTNVTGGQNVIINQQAGDAVVFTTGDGSRSTVLYEDISFSDGLVQIVDTLLVPPTRLEHTALSAYTQLSAFLAALYAANLTSTFSNTPDVTIFAPSITAFQRLAGTLESLSSSELQRLLSYHLVLGSVIPSSRLLNDTNLATSAIPFGIAGTPGAPAGVATLPVHLTRAGNNLYVNSAQVVQPDILIANGVVHMIDNVLDPNATAALPDPNLTAQPPVLPVVAPSKIGTPFASALPCTVSCPVPTSQTSATLASSSAAGAGISGTGTGAGVQRARCTGLIGAGMAGIVAGAGVLGVV